MKKYIYIFFILLTHEWKNDSFIDLCAKANTKVPSILNNEIQSFDSIKKKKSLNNNVLKRRRVIGNNSRIQILQRKYSDSCNPRSDAHNTWTWARTERHKAMRERARVPPHRHHPTAANARMHCVCRFAGNDDSDRRVRYRHRWRLYARPLSTGWYRRVKRNFLPALSPGASCICIAWRTALSSIRPCIEPLPAAHL